MELIAKQGESRYLLLDGDINDPKAKGIVASIEDGVRYPPFNVHSILARGYWEFEKDDPDLVARLMQLPEPRSINS